VAQSVKSLPSATQTLTMLFEILEIWHKTTLIPENKETNEMSSMIDPGYSLERIYRLWIR